MEQQNVSRPSALKYALYNFFSHIELYLQIGLLGFLVTLLCALAEWYTTSTTQFNPIGRIDLIALLIIFRYIFEFWFWGACVFISIKLLRGQKPSIFDFIASLKYAPQFLMIQLVTIFPIILLECRFDTMSLLPVAPSLILNSTALRLASIFTTLALIFFIMLAVLSTLWQLYGQLAIPLFIMKKNGVRASIIESFTTVHHILGKLIGLNIIIWVIYAIVTMVIGISVQGNITIVTSLTNIDRWSLIPTTMRLAFQYPVLALTYVYLCNHMEQKT